MGATVGDEVGTSVGGGVGLGTHAVAPLAEVEPWAQGVCAVRPVVGQ